MDPTKHSEYTRVLIRSPVNNGGNESLMEEAPALWRDGADGERQKDVETREPDVVDGPTAAAEINNHHRGSADKRKFSTFGYQRRTKQKVVTDFATVSKGPSVGAKPRAALKQVLFSQGVSEKSLTSEERGQLDVLKQELATYAVPVSLKWRWKEESQGTTLEKNWTDIVDSHLIMHKTQKHQQEALWEFVHTELTYINKLIIIKDLVIAALVNLHQHGFLLEVTPELLFTNLPSIISAHQLFWQEVIYPMLDEVRRTGMPFDPMKLEAGCLQFHQRFPSYQHYCWEEENNLEFTRRQMESNPHFLTFVQWVETHPQCERMRLGDMQAKPHQRITKYPLLLKAVLKNTEELHVQQALRGMLSSVNSFLESINDYLKLKDEELALTISAQRVEGYEVEGINEEIDKHVREICRFDLTCPIRGVGPEVVRKLLLEENLKIRGRKDSKLEVVALLFSDVLLMTKVQKKGERLKVVRPPLALDRTYCIALKDGCSFLLTEVGELQSAMNVYIFSAGTSESCSTWVSTINQAKETLRSWREKESNKQLKNRKIQRLEAKPVTEANSDDTDTGEQLFMKLGGDFVDELNERFIIRQSVNGMLASKEEEERYQPPNDVATDKVVSFRSLSKGSNRKSAHRGFAGHQQAIKGYEWIEMEMRRQVEIHAEEEEKMVESSMAREESMTCNHRMQSAPNLDHYTQNVGADTLKYNTAAPHALVPGVYPDVDYPMNEDSTSQPTYQATVSKGEGGISTKRNSDIQSVDQDERRNSSFSQSEELETPPEAWSFSKNLKSPGLRKRRPISTHQDPSTQTSRQFFHGSGPALSASFSNSDSDYKPNIKRNFVPSQSSNSHRVLKLGSLKPNQGMFWSMNDSISPDPQTFSEPELPDLNFQDKRSKVKAQRSASIPNMAVEGSHVHRLHSRSLYASPEDKDAMSQHNPNGHSSPLEGLLEKAKERVRDRDRLKRDRNVKPTHMRARYPPNSSSFSTTPSQSPIDGDRETEWEEEVELTRHRALTVSKGWKEQLVDGDEDEKGDSVVFTDGVNVDWSGWCFDDDEVMVHLYPEAEGLLEGISRSLTFWDLQGLSEQEDGECSQV